MAKNSISTDTNYSAMIVGPRGGLRRTLTFKSSEAMRRYLRPLMCDTSRGARDGLRVDALEVDAGYMFAKLVVA